MKTFIDYLNCTSIFLIAFSMGYCLWKISGESYIWFVIFMIGVIENYFCNLYKKS